MKDVALKAALHGEVTNALSKFRHDLAYTPPELIQMRVRDLEQRLHDAVDVAVDALV
jgi:hypothetical protein